MIIPLKPPEELTPYDTAPLWVAMLYPNRPREYHSLLTLMHFESKTYQEGIGPSDIILSELNRIGKSSGQGHVAGVVAVALVQMLTYRPPARLKRAALLASEFFYEKSPVGRNGIRFSAHESDVRKAFRRFKDSIHIWAAWHSVGEKVQLLLVEHDVDAFIHFAQVAAYFEKQLRLTGCMGKWDPYSIPASYVKGAPLIFVSEFEPWAIKVLDRPLRGEGT